MKKLKNMWIVLRYELMEYFRSKGFMAFTLLLAIGGAALLFLPRFVDIFGTGENKVHTEESGEVSKEQEETNADKLLLFDPDGIIEETLLASMFEGMEWVAVGNEEEIAEEVENERAIAGFAVKSPLEYDYYVYNKGFSDSNGSQFDEVMKISNRMAYCEKNGLNYDEVAQMYDAAVIRNEQVLNKDTESNYWYCYVLVIIVFMLIVMYGQMIAVSVTSEKSNRAIEVLVTSTTPESLLFGKVIAGAIGGIFQAGVILGAILFSYGINREHWNGMLDMIFRIPAEVLMAFAAFGIGGYLFYAFIYGAMGALVSKTEDVSKSSSGLMVVIMIVYFFSLTQLMNVDSIAMKILSFLPISSYSTMFARIAMGTVAPWEIIVSFIILAASIVGAGILGSKLYRMGTLRYGNPIKIMTALKSLKSQ